MVSSTLILQHQEILIKIRRLAWEVYENNYRHPEMVVIGIKERGKVVAQLLSEELKKISDIQIRQSYLSLNIEHPMQSEWESGQKPDINNKPVLLVDDVLNTGKTLMLAAIPILIEKPASLETAILANRDHKKFAVSANYVGISLATTLQEHITFSQNKKGEYTVALS